VVMLIANTTCRGRTAGLLCRGSNAGGFRLPGCSREIAKR